MSKDEFVFEWRVGDQIRCRNYGVVATIPDLDNTDFRPNWKPYGKTKKRYKAEKLAWKQSRLKEGDWVKRIKAYWVAGMGEDYNGAPFQIGAKGFDCFIGISGYHHPDYLKPCKPPKPEKSGLSFKDNYLYFDMFKSDVRLTHSNDLLFHLSDDSTIILPSSCLREIADLIDGLKEAEDS